MKKPVVKTKTLSSTEVLLSWDPVEGASDYIVYRAKSLKGKYYEMGTVKSQIRKHPFLPIRLHHRHIRLQPQLGPSTDILRHHWQFF